MILEMKAVLGIIRSVLEVFRGDDNLIGLFDVIVDFVKCFEPGPYQTTFLCDPKRAMHKVPLI